MFWKYKTPNWIQDLENRKWIEENILQLIEEFDENLFIRPSPIVIQKNLNPLLKAGMEVFLNSIAKEMAVLAKINVSDIKVEVYKELKNSDVLRSLNLEYSDESSSGTAGKFYAIDNNKIAHIAIEETQLRDHISLSGTLSHELSHIFIELNKQKGFEIKKEEEEQITDLIAVLLGFGIFMSNSSERFVQYTEEDYTGWYTSKQGYLSLEEICYAQGFVSFLFGQNFSEYKNLLSDNPRQFIKDAIKYFEHNENK